MDTFEAASPAERQAELVEAVCWECGQNTRCYEYVVCCTGTLFHLCVSCEEKTHADGPSATETCPTPTAP